MGFVFNPFTGNFDMAGQTTVNNTGVITIQPVGNTAGTTVAISSGSVVFAGGNNITLSQNGSTISIVGGAGGGGGSINLSAGTTSNNLTNFVLSNSNGLAFGLNGSTITGSYTVPTQTAYSFQNGNGVSFGTNGSTVTATVATNYQSQGAYLTTARASNDAIGLNTALTANGLSVTANSSGLSINVPAWLTTAMQSNASTQFVQANAGFAGTNASGTIASNGISISVAAGGGAGDGYNILGVNGVGTSASTTLQLNNGNNVSFGLNAGTITASASYSQSTQPVAASASNGSFNFSTLKFVEGSGVTWATQANGIQASVKTDYQSSNANYLTSQSNQAISGSNGSFTFQTATFGSSNGMHFYTTNGSLVGSYTVPAQTNPGASASNGSFSFQTLNFSNANNVTFGTSAGGIVTASVAAPGAAAGSDYFYEPYPLMNGNSTTYAPGLGTWHMQALKLPINLASGRINMLFSMASTSNLLAASNGTSWASGSTGGISYSFRLDRTVAIYSRGSGASSTRLESIWSNTLTNGVSQSVGVSLTNASQLTVARSVSLQYVQVVETNGLYTTAGLGATHNASYANSSTATSAHTSAISSIMNIMSGAMLVPFGFNTTLSAGDYWLGVAYSTNSTTAGTSVNGASIWPQVNQGGLYVMSSMSHRQFGATASSTGSQFMPGHGAIYSVLSASPPTTMAFTDLRSVASHAIPYVNFIQSVAS